MFMLRTDLTVCATYTVMLMLLCSAAIAADDPMTCVEEITMPYVTPGMVMSIPANIEIQVAIGTKGEARKISYSSGTPLLRHELDRYFKDKARYKKACMGRTISFTVRFLVEGNETVHAVSEVRFRPPNEFIVRSHPVTPALDPVREPAHN